MNMINKFPYKNIRNKFIISTRQFIFDLNDKFPLIGYPLMAGWRVLCALKFMIWKKSLELRIRLKYSTDKLDLNKVCWTDPQKIQYCLEGEFNQWHSYSRVLEGDWNQSRKRFEDLDVYQAFKQRFEEGKRWEDTEFYHRVLNQISKGIRKWGCKSKKEWDRRIGEIESLYYQIKKNGYKLKEEVYFSEGWLRKIEKPAAILDDISVVIGREGQLLFVNGRHRLSIAKLLNLPKVPFRIIARHKKEDGTEKGEV